MIDWETPPLSPKRTSKVELEGEIWDALSKAVLLSAIGSEEP
ncbi:hypothetical protein GCM10007858_02620 [Bradyrhizobium liaoningense]|nr:hypothetical protein GCM10007858_02620 [Bradyrhizobium liaoningense]